MPEVGETPVVIKLGFPEPLGGHPKDRQGMATCQAAVGARTLSTVVRFPMKKEFWARHECWEIIAKTYAGSTGRLGLRLSKRCLTASGGFRVTRQECGCSP